MTLLSSVFSNFFEPKLGIGIGIDFDFLLSDCALSGVVSTVFTKVFLASSRRFSEDSVPVLMFDPSSCEVSIFDWCEYFTWFGCQFFSIEPPVGVFIGGFDDVEMIWPSTEGSCSAKWCCLPHAFGVLLVLFKTTLL